ncbi:MAG: hypothetical protein H7X89_05600 [Rhizobiales bacterium]|nr:hypothetical protein [Hyphomicrobiales bacterium]
MCQAAWAEGWLKDTASGCELREVYKGEGVGVAWSGKCKNGKASGAGTLKWLVNGEVLATETGTWQDGQLEGEGRSDFNGQGSVFEGTYRDGRPDGVGTFTFKNGSVYKGDVAKGGMSGNGTMNYHDGTFYTGGWKNGKPHGEGHHTFANGNVYEGAFVNGLQNGPGKFTYPGGVVFEGNFVDGQGEGNGVCRDKAGHRGACIFKNGTFVKWK